jgi:hypothetical protein
MTALEGPTEISRPHLAAPVHAAVVCNGELVDEQLGPIVRGLDGEWSQALRDHQP